MLGKLVRIALALALIHATWQVGSAYWKYYRFEDKLTEIAQFGDQRTEPQLCGLAMEAAALLNVPMEPEAMDLRRGANPPFNCGRGYSASARATAGGAQKMSFEGRYTQKVLIFPGYTRDFTFRPSVEVWARVF